MVGQAQVMEIVQDIYQKDMMSSWQTHKSVLLMLVWYMEWNSWKDGKANSIYTYLYHPGKMCFYLFRDY